MIQLEVKKLHTNATIPTKAHEYDAGWDIYTPDIVEVPAWGSRLVPAGIAVRIPSGYSGVLKSRSSVAYKQCCDVAAGVIDEGYTGEIKVLLRNHSEKIKWFNVDERIAQLLLVPVPKANVVEVKEFTTVVGERSDGGFGSTGK